MAIKSIRVLVSLAFPSQTARLWDGAGPYLDLDGEIWRGMVFNEGLDQIETALNGEAATLMLAVSGVDPEIADLAYEDLNTGEIIGSKVQLLIQPCDEWDQPVGDPEVRFTGRVDNMVIDDVAQDAGIVSQITIECANRFDLRTMTSGAVLSDVDQQARSAQINPAASADRFAERIPGLADKAIVWPRYS